mgnify:CR=1 FL=1
MCDACVSAVSLSKKTRHKYLSLLQRNLRPQKWNCVVRPKLRPCTMWCMSMDVSVLVCPVVVSLLWSLRSESHNMPSAFDKKSKILFYENNAMECFLVGRCCCRNHVTDTVPMWRLGTQRRELFRVLKCTPWQWLQSVKCQVSSVYGSVKCCYLWWNEQLHAFRGLVPILQEMEQQQCCGICNHYYNIFAPLVYYNSRRCFCPPLCPSVGSIGPWECVWNRN